MLEPPEPLSTELLILLVSEPAPESWEIVVYVTVMCLLLAISALISGSEVAYFSLEPSQLDSLASSSDQQDECVKELLSHPERLLATILISNNLVNVAIIILSTLVVEGLLKSLALGEFAMYLIQVVLVTFLILMAGEVIPKVYATTRNMELARFMGRPLTISARVFSPISSLLMGMSSLVRKYVRSRSDLTVGHLEQALEITKEDVPDEEGRILEGIVRFGNTDVKQVMTPRTGTFAVDVETTYKELLEGIVENGFSRIPVYKGSLDEVVGLLYIKDLLPFTGMKQFSWQKLIRPAQFVPESKKIDDLLKEFQGKKRHMAIVVDEYGGTSGIITLEDVIEEIVGEITDEFDDEDLNYTKVDDRNFILAGHTPLVDLYRVLDISGDDFEAVKGEADTLAGFIIEQAGKIPLKNEKINFEPYVFTVEAADRRKVRQVKVTLNDIQKDEDE